MRRTALHRRFASAVARRAGLRQGPATAPPRTVLDGYVSPDEPPFARQWLTDLSGISEVRFQSRSSVPVYLFVSPSVADEGLDPGDFDPMLDANSDAIFAEDEPADLAWRPLDDEHKAPVRLTISSESSAVGWDADLFASPFAVSMQAKGT